MNLEEHSVQELSASSRKGISQ